MINEPIILIIQEYQMDITGQYSRKKKITTSGTPGELRGKVRTFRINYYAEDAINIKNVIYRGEEYKVECCLPNTATCFITTRLKKGRENAR
jgi:hypothetical protein